MAEMCRAFVQFPHPGRELVPRGERLPWNLGPHGRKFLRAAGVHTVDGTHLRTGELAFWAEWEPPSRVERRWPADGRLPRALQLPYWNSRPVGSPQNTDPWIWGPCMRYSCCKQVRAGRATAMQRLAIGSVICFGSTIDGEFRLDTVLVVAGRDRWNREGANTGDDEAFMACVGELLNRGSSPDGSCGCGANVYQGGRACDESGAAFTLYSGATVADRVNGMFSFVPARSLDAGDPRFERPAIRLPDLVNPASRQSVRGVCHSLTASRVREAWQTIVDQVLDADLLLAVELQTPARASEMGAVGAPSPRLWPVGQSRRRAL